MGFLMVAMMIGVLVAGGHGALMSWRHPDSGAHYDVVDPDNESAHRAPGVSSERHTDPR